MRPTVLLACVVGGTSVAAQTESHCVSSVGTRCTDDLKFLQCAMERALVALQRSNKDSDQCAAMADNGLCISQPTEMAAYCCKTFSQHCLDGADSYPNLEPPGHSFVINSTTLSDDIPANGSTGDLSIEVVPDREVCAFIKDAASVGTAAMHAVKENFPWILEDLGFSFGEGGTLEPKAASEEETGTSSSRNSRRSLQGNAEPASETNLRNLGIDTEQNGVMAWLSLMTAGDGDLIRTLFPDKNLTAANYARIETRITETGMSMVELLEGCNGCLLPLIKRALGGICLPEDSTRTTQNETILIKLPPSELSIRTIAFARTFLTQLRAQQEAAGQPSQTLGSFVGRLTEALGAALLSDDVGGIFSNLLPIAGYVASQYDNAEKRQHLHSEVNALYLDVFGCTEPLLQSESVTIGQPLIGNDHKAVNGPTQADPIEPSLVEESVELGQRQEGSVKELVPSVFQRRLDIDFESPKESNFIPDLSSSSNKAESITQQLEGEVLEGQPCLDRPSDFVASMIKVYNDLSCTDLISSVGCLPERFLVDLPTFVRGCAQTWTARCLSAGSPTQEIASILSKQHCTSPSSPALRTDSKRADSACSVKLSAALNAALFLISTFLFV